MVIKYIHSRNGSKVFFVSSKYLAIWFLAGCNMELKKKKVIWKSKKRTPDKLFSLFLLHCTVIMHNTKFAYTV